MLFSYWLVIFRPYHKLHEEISNVCLPLGLLSGNLDTGCFSGILSSLFSLFLYPVLQYTTEQVLTIFVKLHSYAAISKVELFVIIVNGLQPLTIITKSSTLDVAAVLDPLLQSN